MSNTLNNNRINYIDVFKAIGIITVVIFHISNAMDFKYWTCTFHMPVFFFAAGLTYKVKPIGEYIKHKFLTTLVPFYCFGILTAIYGLVIERRFRSVDYTIVDCIKGLLLGEFRYLNFNVVLWFLPAFFVAMILFNTLYKLKGPILAYSVSVILALIPMFVHLPSLPFTFERTCSYMIYISIGHIFANWNKTKELIAKPNIPLYLFLSMLSLGVSILLYRSTINVYMLSWVCTLGGVFFLLFLGMALQKSKLLTYIGKNTLMIYILHGQVYRLLIGGFGMLTHQDYNDIRNSTIYSILFTILTIIVCLIIHKIVLKVCPFAMGIFKSKQKNIKADNQ